MCSGALINPRCNITLYYKAYRLHNILHIPMRINTQYQLEIYILSTNTYEIINTLLFKSYIWINLFSTQIF